MRTVPLAIRSMLALRAAGFIATSTLGESPGVRMSWSEMWTWKADTPLTRAGRGPDLGREVREGGQVVAEAGRCSS